MTDEKRSTALSRRSVLRAVGLSGMVLGGIGTVSAAPPADRGNGGSGEQGPPGDVGGGNGGGGGPPDGTPGGGRTPPLTGGSGWMPSESPADIPTDDDPTEPSARFELGAPTDATVPYYMGCDSVGDEHVPMLDYVVYPVTWLDGLTGPSEIYLFTRKPVTSGTYNMIEATTCPSAGDAGEYVQVGYEPASEESHED